MQYRGLALYPFQEAAIQSIADGHSVIVSAPTGAGKTVIAEYAIERALESGQRAVYTSPIKALSNQKYRDFRARHGDLVGIMTGDITLNANAPILVMTTEIFRNTIFEDSGRIDNMAYVIFDEVHYLGDDERGSVWEESIIFAPKHVRFICLSATISNLDELRHWMEQVRESNVELVHTDERPVPLTSYLFLPEIGVFGVSEMKEHLRRARSKEPASELAGGHQKIQHHHQHRRGRERDFRHAPRHDLVRWLISQKKLPALYFSFSRRKCEYLAQRYQRQTLLTRDEQREVVQMFDDLILRYGAEDHPAVAGLRRSTSRGVLFHHAGMLPVFKDIVERLFCSGLVKLLFTTETFALGVNMPAKCVVFDSLTKWNGVEVLHITPLDFRQMAGRAGRQGIDTEGEVYSVLDPKYDSPGKVMDILHKRPGSVSSKFALGYTTILNLSRLLGDEIETAVNKSFAAYQQRSAAKPLAALRKKLAVLQARHYLDGRELTDKGSFCARINGFEIQIAELFWEGCFEDLTPLQCAVLCAAIIYEPRSTDTGAGGFAMSPLPENIVNRAVKRVQEFRRAEVKEKCIEVIRPLDFTLASAISHWASGASFNDMRQHTAMQDGDLVRAFRLTVQVLRQLAWALPDVHHVARSCQEAITLLNRDEIDAERQLKVG
jgi:superfamily II RNA helicase